MPHVIVSCGPANPNSRRIASLKQSLKNVWIFCTTEKSRCQWRWKKSNLRIGSRRSTGPTFGTSGTSSTRSPDTTRKTCEFVANNRGLEGAK